MPLYSTSGWWVLNLMCWIMFDLKTWNPSSRQWNLHLNKEPNAIALKSFIRLRSPASKKRCPKLTNYQFFRPSRHVDVFLCLLDGFHLLLNFLSQLGHWNTSSFNTISFLKNLFKVQFLKWSTVILNFFSVSILAYYLRPAMLLKCKGVFGLTIQV